MLDLAKVAHNFHNDVVVKSYAGFLIIFNIVHSPNELISRL